MSNRKQLETIHTDWHHAAAGYLSCDFCGKAEWESPRWYYDRAEGLYVCADCAASKYRNDTNNKKKGVRYE